MSFILPLCAAGAVSLAFIVVGLRRAPEAYEDEHGFHVVGNRATSSGVLLRRKYQTALLRVTEGGSGQSVIARCASVLAR
jgi:hypothetical protein